MARRTQKKPNSRIIIGVVFILAAAALLTAVVIYTSRGQKSTPASGASNGQGYEAMTYAMNTLVTQKIYGAGAETAALEINKMLARWENRFSMFSKDGDIARINAAAGLGGADVDPQTTALLQHALALSAQSGGAFAITIAPLTSAWGITTDTPRVVPEAELAGLMPLVNDSAVTIQGNHVTLPEAGMGIDLGGIAKGAVCTEVKNMYNQLNISSALISIGGNIYAHGTQPDGTPFTLGFRDPAGDETSYIASFAMADAVIAVSGGYERYFEQDGTRYIHIIDPRTGRPAQSDIASVGVIHEDGATADFYSTTLYVLGLGKTLAYMRSGGQAIVLDMHNTLYVSDSLRDSFALRPGMESTYMIEYIAAQ